MGRGQNRGSDSNSLTCPVYHAEWEERRVRDSDISSWKAVDVQVDD